MRRFFLSERGDAVLMTWLLAMFAVLGVIGFDFARAHAARARLATAVDAAALAGAMAAEAVPEYEYEAVYDQNGQVVEIRKKIVGWHAEIRDAARAKAAADAAFDRNVNGEKMPLTKSVAGKPAARVLERRGEVVTLAWPDRYRYEARLGVRSFLLGGPLASWLLGVDQGAKEIEIRAAGTAQAVVPPQGP